MKLIASMLKSKINWLAIIAILVSLQDAIIAQDFSVMKTKEWVAFALGLITIVVRTWFTSTAIASKKSAE